MEPLLRWSGFPRLILNEALAQRLNRLLGELQCPFKPWKRFPRQCLPPLPSSCENTFNAVSQIPHLLLGHMVALVKRPHEVNGQVSH